MELVDAVVELLRKSATDLPADVEAALLAALSAETTPMARSMLSDYMENIRIARRDGRPICQDTGLPIFFVTAAMGLSYAKVVQTLTEAVGRATREVPLRPNAVDPMTGANTGDGTGEGVPIVYFTQWEESRTVIELLLKGGGSENVGASYKLPDPSLGARRDLDGVRRAVLDAVCNAQGRGCPPYIVAVAVAGTKDDSAVLAKRQLLRRLDDKSPIEALAQLESSLLYEINSLGIGPAGLSGAATALSVKAAVHARHPATFFVEVAFGCWAHRRGRLEFADGKALYE